MWVYKHVKDNRTGDQKRVVVWEDIKIPSLDGENPDVRQEGGELPPKEAAKPKGKK